MGEGAGRERRGEGRSEMREGRVERNWVKVVRREN